MSLIVTRFHHQFIRSLSSRSLVSQCAKRSLVSRYNLNKFAFNVSNNISFRPAMQQHRPAFDFKRYFSNDKKQDSDNLNKEKEDKETKEAQEEVEDVEEVEKSFDEELAELNLFQRYKKLLTEYYYVLLPVHGILSLLWFGSLVLLSKSGVEIDIVWVLEKLHIPETLIKPLRNPHLGHFAIAAVLYKLVSPLRYLSTVTATVPIIKKLVRAGKIKPAPSARRLQRMIIDKLPSSAKKQD